MRLELQEREKIYARVSELVLRKHFDPAMNGADWTALASARRDEVLQSGTDDDFERRMQELLNELKTSHTGFRHAKSPSLSTVHATSARQALARFTSCVLQSGVDLPYRAVKTNIGYSLNVVVQLERRPGRRFVSQVVEIKGYDPDRDEYDFAVIFQSEREPL